MRTASRPRFYKPGVYGIARFRAVADGVGRMLAGLTQELRHDGVDVASLGFVA